MSKEATELEKTSAATELSSGSTCKQRPATGSVSSPSSKFASITKFLKSPRQGENVKKRSKSKQSKKKLSRKKEKSIGKDKEESLTASENTDEVLSSRVKLNVEREKVQEEASSESVKGVGNNNEKDGETSTVSGTRAMVQTSLASTKDGGIEVISSPEQPQPQKRKGKKAGSKKKESRETGGKKQSMITDIFPKRKSSRKCKSEQEKDEQQLITKAILSKKIEGLEVHTIEGKGRGVFASRPFQRNEFVCEYSGELISYDEAKKREQKYSEDSDIGCYMYYLQCNNKKYCVDATAEDGTIGRLLNHGRKGNCKTKVHVIEDIPHLIFVTKHDIKLGEELTYDYGDRSKDAIQSHPWLKY